MAKQILELANNEKVKKQKNHLFRDTGLDILLSKMRNQFYTQRKKVFYRQKVIDITEEIKYLKSDIDGDFRNKILKKLKKTSIGECMILK